MSDVTMPPDARAWARTRLDGPAPRAPGSGRRSGRSAARRHRTDMATRLLLAAAGALALGVLSLLLWRASRDLLHPPAGAPASMAATPSSASSLESIAHAGRRPLSDRQLRQGLAQARERLAGHPRDASALAMLAHSQAMLGEFAAARQSYRQLAELMPRDAQVLADWADAAAVAQGRRLAGEPAQLVARALDLDPKNLKALMLAGREAFERKRYGEAIGFWERALQAAPDATLATDIEASVAEARAFDGRERPPPEVVRQAGGATVAGRITLAPALASAVSPDDTLFVFARPLRGSRMPVALLRKRVRDLPLTFTLDDSMAMVPEIRLSMLAGVAVGARVSRRGDATPSAGDLQGLVEPVSVGARNVDIVIGEVLR